MSSYITNLWDSSHSSANSILWYIKHLVVNPASFSILQPVIDVASHVVFFVLPWNQIERATVQSRLIRPNVWLGKKKELDEGWMIVLWVKFQVGDHVGGGQGTPFRAQVGLGRERDVTNNGP